MSNPIIIFLALVVFGIVLLGTILYNWPEPNKKEDRYIRRGMPDPPDPNRELVKQLKRSNFRLQRVLYGSEPVRDSELIKTINQNNKLLKQVKQSDESNSKLRTARSR